MNDILSTSSLPTIEVETWKKLFQRTEIFFGKYFNNKHIIEFENIELEDIKFNRKEITIRLLQLINRMFNVYEGKYIFE
jgi:hypothetical protein